MEDMACVCVLCIVYVKYWGGGDLVILSGPEGFLSYYLIFFSGFLATAKNALDIRFGIWNEMEGR